MSSTRNHDRTYGDHVRSAPPGWFPWPQGRGTAPAHALNRYHVDSMSGDPSLHAASRLVLLACLALVPALRAAAPPTAFPARDPIFGLTRIHEMHLTIGADDWAK